MGVEAGMEVAVSGGGGGGGGGGSHVAIIRSHFGSSLVWLFSVVADHTPTISASYPAARVRTAAMQITIQLSSLGGVTYEALVVDSEMTALVAAASTKKSCRVLYLDLRKWCGDAPFVNSHPRVWRPRRQPNYHDVRRSA